MTYCSKSFHYSIPFVISVLVQGQWQCSRYKTIAQEIKDIFKCVMFFLDPSIFPVYFIFNQLRIKNYGKNKKYHGDGFGACGQNGGKGTFSSR